MENLTETVQRELGVSEASAKTYAVRYAHYAKTMCSAGETPLPLMAWFVRTQA